MVLQQMIQRNSNIFRSAALQSICYEQDAAANRLWTSGVESNRKTEAAVTPAFALPASTAEDKKAVVNVASGRLMHDESRQQKYGAAAMSTASPTSRPKAQAAKSSSSVSDAKITHHTDNDTSSSVHSCSETTDQDSIRVQVKEFPNRSTITTVTDFSFPSDVTSEISKNSLSLPSSSVVETEDLASDQIFSSSRKLTTVWNQSEMHMKPLALAQGSQVPLIKGSHGSPPDEPSILPRPFGSPSFYDLMQQSTNKASVSYATEKSSLQSVSEKVSTSISSTVPGKSSKDNSTTRKGDDANSDVLTVSSKKSVGLRSDKHPLKNSISAAEAMPSSSQSSSTRAKESERSARLGESSLAPGQHFDPNKQSSTWNTAHSVQQSIQPSNLGDPRDGLLQSSREDILNLSERERPKKVEPSTKMKAALKVVNDLLEKSPVTTDIGSTAKAANVIIQREWFQVSSTPSADPHIVEDYLDHFEEMSSTLLTYVVNMADKAGNTAMHYALSQGNFDVVSILLDSKVCNINLPNAAGYTAVMLVSLAQIRSDTHKCVLQRFLADADVNVRAQQHGQTALMLAVSHNRLDMVQLLIEGGADLNIQDDDGSTALMCAAEHGHAAIVQFLINQPDTDLNIKDVDGLTALDIALDAGHKDVGILLYAHKHFSRNNSPYSSLRGRRSKSATPTTRTASTPPPKTPSSPLPARHNPRHSHD